MQWKKKMKKKTKSFLQTNPDISDNKDLFASC